MPRGEETSPERSLGVSPLFPPAMLGLWVLFSGKLDVFHLGMGVLAVLFVTLMSLRLISRKEAARPRMRIFATAWYIGWLALQMILSAIHVLRVIVNPERHLDPRIVELHSPQPSNLSRILLANSITLTPGTLTVDMADGDIFIVHALTQKTAADLLADEMGRRVAALNRLPGSGGARATTTIESDDEMSRGSTDGDARAQEDEARSEEKEEQEESATVGEENVT